MTEVIILCSSDEDDGEIPVKKRIKPTHLLSECTITRIKKNNNDKVSLDASGPISDIVEVNDSDEELASTTNNETFNCVQKTGTIESITIDEDGDCVNKEFDNLEEDRNLDSDLVIINESSVSNIKVSETDCKKNDVDVLLEDKSNSPQNTCNLETDVNADKEKDSCDKDEECAMNGKELVISSKDLLVEARSFLNNFIDLVKNTVRGSKYESVIEKKIPILLKYFKKCEQNLMKSYPHFESKISELSDQAKISSAKAVIKFTELFKYVKINVETVEQYEVDEKHLYKVIKLEKTIKLLIKKIDSLENMEINFDDDEDSSYIQLDRYQIRLKKVYEKYCKYLKKNPYSGRLIYDKIDFSSSKYNAVNLALNKKYKNSLKFPSYYDIEKYVRKVVNSENLSLSEEEIRSESKTCFKKLAEVLQKRRKMELYEAHSSVIENTEDPAVKDSSLDNVLKKNYEEGKLKIEQVVEDFVKKEELGQEEEKEEDEEDDPMESEESDTSDNEST